MCNDPYVDCVVDFNKNVSGYESCIVGEKSGFQPSNIGSSEGILREELVLNRAGTLLDSDFILHIDTTFKEREGRIAEGIMAARRCADRILENFEDQ